MKGYSTRRRSDHTQIAKMSKRKTGKDDSTPHENEELSERQSNGKRDKKKQKKARREEMEAAKPQTEKKTHKRKRGDEEDEEDGTSGYNDRGPKDSIKQGVVSNKEKDSKKKKKKKSKKAKKAPSSEDEAEQLSESKSKKEKKASKKEKKEKKKSKKEKKAKKSKGTTAEEKEKASNGDSAKEKEVETGASSATSTSSNGGASDQGGAGWNNWEASSFGDDARKNKFLRLMGAKKTGDTPSQPPQKKGLFGSLRASTAAPEPSAIDSSTEQKITHDLASQFQDALLRRNCRGGIGLDSGTKKSDRSAEPQPHPYTGGKASTKLHIDDYPKSIKFDD